MGYTADITGFPYWKNTLVKVERKSWDKVARDLMKVADQRTELEKSVGKTEDWLDKEMLKNEKLKKDMKSLKKENKFYLRKMEKMRKKMKELEEENKKLKDRLHYKDKEIKAYEKGALNHGQIALRQEEKIKELKLELKAAQEVSVVYMKRYDQKAKEERQIDEICSRIKCEDTLGHLIGKVPHH
jgi:chromosome segregation ATPase